MKVIFKSEEAAIVVIAVLSTESTYFAVTPLPDGEYEIDMRPDMPKRLMDQIKTLRRCLCAVMNKKDIENVSENYANIPLIFNVFTSLRVGFVDDIYESIVKTLGDIG